jgi:hypothetical protein
MPEESAISCGDLSEGLLESVVLSFALNTEDVQKLVLESMDVGLDEVVIDVVEFGGTTIDRCNFLELEIVETRDERVD